MAVDKATSVFDSTICEGTTSAPRINGFHQGRELCYNIEYSAKNLNRGYDTEEFLSMQVLGVSVELFLIITCWIC